MASAGFKIAPARNQQGLLYKNDAHKVTALNICYNYVIITPLAPDLLYQDIVTWAWREKGFEVELRKRYGYYTGCTVTNPPWVGGISTSKKYIQV